MSSVVNHLLCHFFLRKNLKEWGVFCAIPPLYAPCLWIFLTMQSCIIKYYFIWNKKTPGVRKNIFYCIVLAQYLNFY